MFRTRVGPVVIPRRPVFRAIFFDGDFTQRSEIPLGTVSRIPQSSLKATPPVGLGLGKLQLRPLRIILDFDESGQSPLNRMPHIAEPVGIAVVPTRVCPRGEGLHVIAPIVIERYPVF